MTLPLDQTEGFEGRRQFHLPADDLEWLESIPFEFELVAENRVLRVVLYHFPLPAGYQRREVDLNVRIEPGYPDTQIDMAYVYPPLERLDRRSILALSNDAFDGKQWQRWSRHRTPANPWRPGVDNLATHFGLVENTGSSANSTRADLVHTATLSLTRGQHAELMAHLFPGDGLEAVAVALCGHRCGSDRHKLLVRRVVPRYRTKPAQSEHGTASPGIPTCCPHCSRKQLVMT